MSHEFGDIVSGDTAAVKDAQALCETAAIKVIHNFPDDADDFIGLFTGGRFPGPDCPDRLISNDEIGRCGNIF